MQHTVIPYNTHIQCRLLLVGSVLLISSLLFSSCFHIVFQTQGTPTALMVGYFICFGIHGICSGTAMTQMVVVLSDWVGPARLPHSLALTMLVLGLLISPGQFAIGRLTLTRTHDQRCSVKFYPSFYPTNGMYVTICRMFA